MKLLAALGCWLSFTFIMPKDPVVTSSSGDLPPLRIVATLLDELGVALDTIPIYQGPSIASGPPIPVAVGATQKFWLYTNADSIGRRIRVGTVGHTNRWSEKSNAVDFAAGLSPYGSTYWDYPFYDMVPSAWDLHCCSFAHSTYRAEDGSWVWATRFRIGPAAETTIPILGGAAVQTPPPHIRITGRP